MNWRLWVLPAGVAVAGQVLSVLQTDRGPSWGLRRRFSPLTEARYTPARGEVVNPERGFFQELSFDGRPLRLDLLRAGNTLVRVMVRLDAFRHTELSASFLQALQESLALARSFGVKLILRFAYNDGPYPNSEPDAPLAVVAQHLAQLEPVLEYHKDVIAWFEAGFVGAWGEWHSSTFGLDSPENKLVIRDWLLSRFPQDRFVLFRYPKDIIAWYPVPLREGEAFSSLAQARVGHHNDCFLASPDDEGTYLDQDGSNLMVPWQAYLATMTRFVPMAGETCAPFPPRSDCATALSEMALLHWTALNEDWHPEVIVGFKNQGCYGTIREKLGYRLVLTKALWSSRLLPGSRFELWLALKNEGFAAPLLPRSVLLVLAGAGRQWVWPLAVDPRRWEPGEHGITARLLLPQELPPGTYQLGLWLPDPSPSLRQDPRYAIRFANEGVWDPRIGVNVLGEVSVGGGS